jgi:NAD-dependent SIR2 family protein deacetylase
MTALAVLRNPLSLLGRLDDIAQDIESLQLSEKIWQVVDGTARSLGITQELSERLKRVTCSYCGIANPIGDPSCIACGAPLGSEQPETCKKCGFVIKKDECICPNCGQPL